MSERRWKTEFIVRRYDSPERLAEIMQELHTDGWRADSVKLSKDSEEGGWTIFSRSYELEPSLTSIDFPAKLIWNILNDHTLFGDYDDPKRQISKEISDRLKNWYQENLVRL